MLRTHLLASLALPLGASLTAQEVLLFRANNLAAVPPLHTTVDAAIRHLCAGPTAAELAAGYSSQLPPGTRLLRSRTNGPVLELLFSDTLLRAGSGCSLESALEQINKTALNAPGITDVRIAIGFADGSEQDLGDLLGHGKASLPQPPAPPPVTSLTGLPGALAGKRIAVSPGHGYYWHSTLGWTTQRGAIDGLTEDIHTAEICNQYLIPFLQNLGADVVMTREHGEENFNNLVDNDAGAPSYTETGGWSTSVSSGYNGGGYRFASTGATETATATWQIPVAHDGFYPVFVWLRASSNRTPQANYRIHHTGGVSDAQLDQTRDNLTWAHLGNYWFSAAQGARIELSNQSAAAGVVIADTVRLGGGLGSLVRGGTTSNRLRWQECARYWAQFSGAPSTVYDSIAGGQDNDDDVTARPRFAEWRTADAYIALHTNAGGGAGTDTFIYSGTPTAGSAALSNAVHTQIVSDLRTYYNSAWVDRGQQSANFGEVRLLSTMPGILVELAFHDTAGSVDHTALHQPEFRYLAARAYARGVLRYFFPTAVFPPEPPTALRVTQDGLRGLRVAWDAAPGATSYSIEQSNDGKGFVQVGTTSTTNWSTGALPHHTVLSFRVRAHNGSGRSFPTEVLTAGTDHRATAQVLLVQGFDRLDRYVKGPENTHDYLRFYGDAIVRDASSSLGFDAASNEAVQLGRVALPFYRAVVWSLGEESTGDDTFNGLEQTLVTNYLSGGGRLLVSGAEIGWDLDAQGSAADRSFYRNVLGATYAADDANTYGLQAGIAGTISAGATAGSFDNGTNGTYNVDYPDVLSPTSTASTVCLRYNNGLTAGIQKVDPITGARIVNFGFPLETILDANLRAQLVQQSLGFLMAPLPLFAPATARIGQRLDLQLTLPSEAGYPYYFFASLGTQPGLLLPNGGLLPVQADFLFAATFAAVNPFFGNFLGTLGAGGTANPFVMVPNLPLLVGMEVYFAGFSVENAVVQERQITNWVRVSFVP
jgi:N-acetylmuramoyl-L-alanine amidase